MLWVPLRRCRFQVRSFVAQHPGRVEVVHPTLSPAMRGVEALVSLRKPAKKETSQVKILHVLYQSWPDRTGGSIRSHEVLRSQREAGLDIVAFSSPFQPPWQAGCRAEVMDDVLYYRPRGAGTGPPISERGSGTKGRLKKLALLRPFADEVAALAATAGCDVVHAHNNFLMARVGLAVSRKLSLPLVYEVRSLWEERLRTSGGGLIACATARAARWCEEQAVRNAQAVVAINDGLAAHIHKRTLVQPTVIRNAVELRPVEITAAGERTGNTRFGYVGSFSPIEGLEMLIESFRLLNARFPDVTLTLFGGGSGEANVQQLASDVRGVTVLGPFAFEERARVYQQLDAVVLPRLPSYLAQVVTPLKPLEAMAFGRPVIASDVGGHREVIECGVTGWLFRSGDPQSLFDELVSFLNRPRKDVDEVVRRARALVAREHSWRQRAEDYRSLYRGLLS